MVHVPIVMLATEYPKQFIHTQGHFLKNIVKVSLKMYYKATFDLQLFMGHSKLLNDTNYFFLT